MAKPFRAVVMLNGKPSGVESVISAESDFDAFMQAKRALGSETHFDLWEGQRRALSFKPPVSFVSRNDSPA